MQFTSAPYPQSLQMVVGASLPAAAVLLGLASFGIGPGWLDLVGALLVGAAYIAGLAMRTGGRPVVFGVMALVLGSLAAVSGLDVLRTGAALMVAGSTAVLAVMMTVPAVRFSTAVREALVAAGLSVLGGFAVVGFRPSISVERFDYGSLALAIGLGFALVYRLGAGWHGLGRRGLAAVVCGTVALAVSVVYAELLRQYGSAGVIDQVFAGARWSRETFGAAPRPLQVLIGWPALVWGCHMRARRRQGWWVCVFGCAATVSVAGTLTNPATGWIEAGLIVAYSLGLGMIIGFILIRIDLMLTGSRGSRARRAEELTAVRPEPKRLYPLL